jgi:hypothetical protein
MALFKPGWAWVIPDRLLSRPQAQYVVYDLCFSFFNVYNRTYQKLALYKLIRRNYELPYYSIYTSPNNHIMFQLAHNNSRDGKRALVCVSMPQHQILAVKLFI